MNKEYYHLLIHKTVVFYVCTRMHNVFHQGKRKTENKRKVAYG